MGDKDAGIQQLRARLRGDPIAARAFAVAPMQTLGSAAWMPGAQRSALLACGADTLRRLAKECESTSTQAFYGTASTRRPAVAPALTKEVLLALAKLDDQLRVTPALHAGLVSAPLDTIGSATWLTSAERRTLLGLSQMGIVSHEQLAATRPKPYTCPLTAMTVTTMPHSPCRLGSLGNAGHSRTMYADGDGIVRFYVRDDEVDRMHRLPALCWERDGVQSRRLDPRAKPVIGRRDRVTPAIRDPHLAPQEELIAQGRPRRPGTNSGSGYSKWLSIVSRPTTKVDSIFATRDDRRHWDNPENFGSAYPWCGFENQAPSGPFVWNMGTITVPSVSLPSSDSGWATHASLWVGIAGWQNIPLVQAGVHMEQDFFGFQSYGYCIYYPWVWWEIFPQLTSQQITGMPCSVGDEIFVYLYVYGKTAYFYVMNDTTGHSNGTFSVQMSLYDYRASVAQNLANLLKTWTWTGNGAQWVLEMAGGQPLLNFGTANIGWPAVAMDSSGNEHTPLTDGGIVGQKVPWDFIVFGPTLLAYAWPNSQDQFGGTYHFVSEI